MSEILHFPDSSALRYPVSFSTPLVTAQTVMIDSPVNLAGFIRSRVWTCVDDRTTSFHRRGCKRIGAET